MSENIPMVKNQLWVAACNAMGVSSSWSLISCVTGGLSADKADTILGRRNASLWSGMNTMLCEHYKKSRSFKVDPSIPLDLLIEMSR